MGKKIVIALLFLFIGCAGAGDDTVTNTFEDNRECNITLNIEIDMEDLSLDIDDEAEFYEIELFPVDGGFQACGTDLNLQLFVEELERQGVPFTATQFHEGT